MKYILETGNIQIDYKDGFIRKNAENIFETPFSDFDVCADDKGNLFILCQNNANGIYLITVSGKDVNERCLLESRSNEGYEKHFNTEYVNGWINAIYSIKHENKFLLIHHIINSDINPFVVDSLDEETKIFLFKDFSDNLYAVYKNEDIGFKKYDWKTKKWSEFEKICDADGQLLFASGDFSKEPEFVISQKQDKTVSVHNREQKILSNVTQDLEPVIIYYRRDYNVLFEYQGRILQSVRKDAAAQFTAPKYAYFGSLAKYELLTVLSDTYKTKTYGSLTPRGTYRTLLSAEKPVKEEIQEPKEEKEEIRTEKKYEEIIKLLENRNEYEILSTVLKKLETMEKQLEEIKNGNSSEQS